MSIPLILGGLAAGSAGFSVVPDGFVQQWFPELTNISLALIGFLLDHQLSIAALRASAIERSPVSYRRTVTQIACDS